MTVPLILLTMTALQPLSCIVLTGRVTVYLSYVTNTLSCFYCHCDDLKTPESKGRRITRQTEIETMCVEDVWGGGVFAMTGSLRNILLATSQPPLVSSLEAVKGLLARSSFHP